jgi:hypothetical protein
MQGDGGVGGNESRAQDQQDDNDAKKAFFSKEHSKLQNGTRREVEGIKMAIHASGLACISKYGNRCSRNVYGLCRICGISNTPAPITPQHLY